MYRQLKNAIWVLGTKIHLYIEESDPHIESFVACIFRIPISSGWTQPKWDMQPILMPIQIVSSKLLQIKQPRYMIASSLQNMAFCKYRKFHVFGPNYLVCLKF